MVASKHCNGTLACCPTHTVNQALELCRIALNDVPSLGCGEGANLLASLINLQASSQLSTCKLFWECPGIMLWSARL